LCAPRPAETCPMAAVELNSGLTASSPPARAQEAKSPFVNIDDGPIQAGRSALQGRGRKLFVGAALLALLAAAAAAAAVLWFAVSGGGASAGPSGKQLGPPTLLGAGMLPPWWILNGVKPLGAPKDIGSWKAITFSKEQQDHFGVSETGDIRDVVRHKEALAALRVAKRVTEVKVEKAPQVAGVPSSVAGLVGKPSSARPPWWILAGVKPQGKEKGMGSWTAISFSKDQQELFGIDEDGKVLNRARFQAATADHMDS